MRVDDVLHGQPCRLNDRLDIFQTLPGLVLDGFGQFAGRIPRALAGDVEIVSRHHARTVRSHGFGRRGEHCLAFSGMHQKKRDEP